MSWKQFYFESNMFFDNIAGPEDWMRLKAAYPNMSDDELLDAKEATYGGHRTKADRDIDPNYGLRSEHDGVKRLRYFFEENDMLRLIPGQDAKDAARYRWLRTQHWAELRDIPAVQAVQKQSEISITKDEWELLQVVMRSLTWGKLDASVAWYQLVESVEARMETIPLDTSKPQA